MSAHNEIIHRAFLALKDNEPLTKKQAEDILNGKPIEEMKRLKDSE